MTNAAHAINVFPVNELLLAHSLSITELMPPTYDSLKSDIVCLELLRMCSKLDKTLNTLFKIV